MLQACIEQDIRPILTEWGMDGLPEMDIIEHVGTFSWLVRLRASLVDSIEEMWADEVLEDRAFRIACLEVMVEMLAGYDGLEIAEPL